MRRTAILVFAFLVIAGWSLIPGSRAYAACTVADSGGFDVSPLTTPGFTAAVGDTIIIQMTHTGTQVSAELRFGVTTVAQINNSPDGLTLTYVVPGGGAGTYDAFLSDNEGDPTPGTTTFYTVSVCPPGSVVAGVVDPGFVPGDDRENPQPWAPVVIYCREVGIVIYDVGADSKGTLVLLATQAQIDAVGDSPAQNTVIASAQASRGPLTLYRLTGGEFQVVTADLDPAKTYSFTWDGCED